MTSHRSFQDSQIQYKSEQNNNFSLQIEKIFLKLFKQGERILEDQCLEALSNMIDDITDRKDDCLKVFQNTLFMFLTEIQRLQQKNIVTVCKEDYEVLQQSLQKTQSEIRKHIRIQQQLKLYLDGIEEKNQNLERQLKIEEGKYIQLFQSMKSIDQQKKQLLKKLKKMQQRNKYLNQRQKQKQLYQRIKGHKSAKLISESLTKTQLQGMSMYKSKPNILNHQHSKSKTSEKSCDEKPDRSLVHRKSKLKMLDPQIDISLSKPTHQHQSKDQFQQAFVPTQQDIRIFKEMTKTVQMKQAYKRPLRKVTKFKTQAKDSQPKDKITIQPSNRDYRSISMYQ